MRIDSLTVENFRCFEHFTLELDPRCNVLIGENASGKTALLDALAIGLKLPVADLSKSFDPSQVDLGIDPRDFRLVLEMGNGVHQSQPAPSASIRLDYQTFGRHLHSAIFSNRTADRYEHPRSRDSEHSILPLIAWMPTNRSKLESRPDAPEKFQSGDRLQGYRDALRPDRVVSNLREWMSWRSNANNAAVVQQLKAGLDPEELQSPELRAITNVVTTCIPGAQHFWYNADHERLEVEFDDGRLLPFSTLSSGYQSFLALVADLAWRCWQLNPQFEDAAPKKTDGVVLIDEIDLHLHPAWQREVLGRLLEAFPKVQFVVTTHSPQVIASAQPEWIRILDPKRNEAILIDHVHGKDTNTILQQVMGVAERPDEMREKLDKLARKIDDDEFEEARELLDEIIEDLGDNDPKVVGLEWELSMARAGIHADD